VAISIAVSSEKDIRNCQHSMGRPITIEDDEGGNNSLRDPPHITTGYTISPTGSDPAFHNSERTIDNFFLKEGNRSVLLNVSGKQHDDSSTKCLSLKRSLSQSPSRNNPHKILKLAIERSVVEEAHQDHNSHRGPLTESNPQFHPQRRRKDNTGTQSDVKSSHEDMKASSLHTLAMACEKITWESETKGKVHDQSKMKSSEVPPLPNSQDVTKPYSNLSNEWVVPSRPASENIVPADNLSVTSPISINDVLCGRGGLTNHHPGNIFFRKLVRQYQESYLRATKRDKAGVAKGIVDTIRKLQPPGRFLKKGPRDVSANGVWVEIGDRKAREKTSQALRERAPELREELECQVRQQQQPYLNVVSSDEKTPLDFCGGRKNPAVGNVVVRPMLSNALVGPNVVLSLDSIPVNMQSSSQKDYRNSDKISSTHDSNENLGTLIGSRPNFLSREVTVDSVHSSLGADHPNTSKVLSSNEKRNTPDEATVDSVRSSDLISVDIDAFDQTLDVFSREKTSQREKEIESIKAENVCERPTAIPSLTSSTPFSFQSNEVMRTVSSGSGSSDDLCVKEHNGGNSIGCEKSISGGPRIKALKERVAFNV